MQTRLIDVPGAEHRALAPEAAWHTLSVEEVLRAEEADPRHGLSSAEAATRADRFGPNTLAAGRAEPRWRAFIRQYSDPMQIVMTVCAAAGWPLASPRMAGSVVGHGHPGGVHPLRRASG